MSEAAIPSPPVVTRPSRIAGLTVAKAGLMVTSRDGRANFIGGFAISRKPERAAFVARQEVFERLLALHPLAARHFVEGRARGLSWPDLAPAASIAPESCLLGPHPFGEPPYLDANGLAFRGDVVSAARHGVFEILERHLAADIWYGDRRVVEQGQLRPVCDQFSVRVFSIQEEPHLPFAIAVITDSDGRFAAGGSCLSTDFAGARRHAIEEAMLLLDGLLEDDRGACASSRQRVLSLRDPDASAARIAHFEARCAGRDTGRRPSRSEDAAAAIRALIETAAPIQIAVLGQRPDGFVIRAIAKNLISLPAARLQRATGTPDDWYC